MIDKDIEQCLSVLKECMNDRQSAFDYKLISTLEKCKQLEADNKALSGEIEGKIIIIQQLEADNKALSSYANNVIECLNEYEDSQTSEEYKQTLDEFHHGVFLLSEGITKL